MTSFTCHVFFFIGPEHNSRVVLIPTFMANLFSHVTAEFFTEQASHISPLLSSEKSPTLKKGLTIQRKMNNRLVTTFTRG